MLSNKRDILINDILPKVLSDIVKDYLITDQEKVAEFILNQKEPIFRIPYNKYQTIAINWIDSKNCGDPSFFDYALTIILKDGEPRGSRLFTMQSFLAKTKEDQKKHPIVIAYQYYWKRSTVYVGPLSDELYNCMVDSISKMLNV